MNDEDKPNRLRLISSNTDTEIKRAQCLRNHSYKLRKVSANLLRVVRGAGKPTDVELQMQEVIDSLGEIFGETNTVPMAEEISDMLRVELPLNINLNQFEYQLQAAEEKIIRGALQIAASRLLKQNTQASAGSREMHEGIRLYNETIKNRRKLKDSDDEGVELL